MDIELKKGNPKKLLGKLIAYATVDPDGSQTDSNFNSMIRNGILAVQANYVDQRNNRDFFESEFGCGCSRDTQPDAF